MGFLHQEWAKTDGTLAASNCKVDNKTPRGSFSAMTARTQYYNYLCVLSNGQYGFATYTDQLVIMFFKMRLCILVLPKPTITPPAATVYSFLNCMTPLQVAAACVLCQLWCHCLALLTPLLAVTRPVMLAFSAFITRASCSLLSAVVTLLTVVLALIRLLHYPVPVEACMSIYPSWPCSYLWGVNGSLAEAPSPKRTIQSCHTLCCF